VECGAAEGQKWNRIVRTFAACLLISGLVQVAHASSTVGVTYLTSDGESFEVKPGEELNQAVVFKEPMLRWALPNGTDDEGPSDLFYLLLLLDPDAPQPYVKKEGNAVRHWAVSNIPSESLEHGEFGIERGWADNLYFAPRPPKGTGPHRYIFKLYEQPKANLFFGLPIDHVGRFDFDVEAFANLHGLRLVAENSFTCQYPSSRAHL